MRIVDAPQTVTVADGSGTTASQTNYSYDQSGLQGSGAINLVPPPGPNRGNLTTAQRLISGSSYAITTYSYWDTGQLYSMTDPCGNATCSDMSGSNHTTTYSYADSYSSGTGTPPGQTAAYLTQVTHPNTGVAHVESFAWGYADGLIRSYTDQNNQPTTYKYNTPPSWCGSPDGLDRLSEVDYPDQGQTTYCYNDTPPNPAITTHKLMSPGVNITTVNTMDGMLHSIENELGSDPQGPDYTATVYDGMGRVHQTYNATRCTSPTTNCGEPTWGYSMITYDPLNRKTSQVQPDGNSVQWTYNGDCTTSTDEAGNTWTRCTDALGRLTSVLEPGNISTSYGYDPLGNLLNVKQSGVSGETPRTRSFTYDSLSRLISATNPETGTICYGQWNSSNCNNGYDGNGNLVYKTDARGIVTSYSYDALNRITNKQSSGGSGVPGFNYTYGYDSVSPPEANGIGRLLWTTNGTGEAEQYFYDAMGRLTSQALYLPSAQSTPQWTSGVYDLAGNMTDLTYPDGHHIKQSWDAAGHLTNSSMVDINGASSSQTYLSSALYNPDGKASTISLGNNVQETVVENNRLQTHSINLASTQAPYSGNPFLSHTYCYANCTSGGVADNGNIWQVADTLNSKLTQDFTYDSLNRIKGFSLGGVQNQQFHLDSFGNMSLVAGNGTPLYSLDATNKISNLPCASSAAPYDSAGNQTCDTDPNGAVRTYGYDGTNQIGSITMTGSSQPFETYVYNANGNRVRKTNADGTFTEYVDFGGQPIAQKDQTGNWTDYIYANGKQIAQIAPSDTAVHMHGSTTCTTCGVIGVSWFFSDPLANYVIKPGDKISWRQYQSSTVGGGIQEGWTSCGAFDPSDTTGQSTRTGNVQNAWQQRTIDLTPYVGCIFQTFRVGVYSSTATGDWDLWFADMVLYSSDGTVIPIMYRQSPISPQLYEAANETNYSVGIDSTTVPVGDLSAQNTVAYTLSDHLNTAQMTFSGGGWPVWKGEFAPFGQELDTQYTSNNFKFTGKERDAESGNDYFGARYYGSSMGRFMSPDPQTPTPLHLLNPQRWNMYVYGLNNPLSFTDSGGRDAAAVNFSKEIAIVGHEGIMSVTSDGTVRYARFGPVGGGRATGEGLVQSFTLKAKIQFDSNGNPTSDSLNAVKKELATTGPEKGQDPSSIRLNYFKTTDQETANLNQWIDQQQAASNQGKSPRYNVLRNNCADFCLRGLVAGDALTQSQANHMSFVPNTLFNDLNQLQLQEPKTSVTTTECDTLPNGTTRCY